MGTCGRSLLALPRGHATGRLGGAERRAAGRAPRISARGCALRLYSALGVRTGRAARSAAASGSAQTPRVCPAGQCALSDGPRGLPALSGAAPRPQPDRVLWAALGCQPTRTGWSTHPRANLAGWGPAKLRFPYRQIKLGESDEQHLHCSPGRVSVRSRCVSPGRSEGHSLPFPCPAPGGAEPHSGQSGVSHTSGPGSSPPIPSPHPIFALIASARTAG